MKCVLANNQPLSCQYLDKKLEKCRYVQHPSWNPFSSVRKVGVLLASVSKQLAEQWSIEVPIGAFESIYLMSTRDKTDGG